MSRWNPREVTPEQRETILEMAGRARPWKEIKEATGLSIFKCETVLKEEGLWPKPAFLSKDRFDPPWWPGPDDPIYDDNFVLKPEDRARYEEVTRLRREGRPIRYDTKKGVRTDGNNA